MRGGFSVAQHPGLPGRAPARNPRRWWLRDHLDWPLFVDGAQHAAPNEAQSGVVEIVVVPVVHTRALSTGSTVEAIQTPIRERAIATHADVRHVMLADLA